MKSEGCRLALDLKYCLSRVLSDRDIFRCNYIGIIVDGIGEATEFLFAVGVHLFPQFLGPL